MEQNPRAPVEEPVDRELQFSTMADEGKKCPCESKVQDLENTVHFLLTQVKHLERNMEAMENLKKQVAGLENKVNGGLAAMLPCVQRLLAETEHRSRSCATPPAAAVTADEPAATDQDSSSLPELSPLPSPGTSAGSNGTDRPHYEPAPPSAPPTYEEAIAESLSVPFQGEVSRRKATPERRVSRLEEAAKMGYVSTVENLLRCGASSNREQLNSALIAAGSMVVVQMLLDAGADPNAQDSDGCSGLHRAAQLGLEAKATALTRAGSLVQARDNWGNTPLHVAALCGQEEVARVLLGAGALRNARNNDGKIPYDVALSSSMEILLR